MPDKMYGKMLQDELPPLLEAIREREQMVGVKTPPYQMIGEPQTQAQLGQALVRQAQDQQAAEQEAIGRATVRLAQERAAMAKRR